MIAKVLGTVYLSVLGLLSIWYIYFQISDWIDRMRARKKMREANTPEKPLEPVIDVVGKSNTAFLSPLISASIEPMMGEGLVVEAEPNINLEDVEINLPDRYIPDEEELAQYANDYVDLSGEFSQGLTFEQISQAIDVIQGKKSGEAEEIAAGETFSFMASDFLDMICAQVDHEAVVKRLISCYVDAVGKVKPIPALVANFDINKYV